MKTILLVEDEAAIAMLIRDALEAAGYRVLHAEEGTQGLWMLEEHQPHLSIFDIMLPKMDGITLTRRSRELGYKGPIILMTAKTDEATVVEGLSVGADDYLRKPVGMVELVARVKAHLRGKERYGATNDVSEKTEWPFGKIFLMPIPVNAGKLKT